MTHIFKKEFYQRPKCLAFQFVCPFKDRQMVVSPNNATKGRNPHKEENLKRGVLSKIAKWRSPTAGRKAPKAPPCGEGICKKKERKKNEIVK